MKEDKPENAFKARIGGRNPHDLTNRYRSDSRFKQMVDQLVCLMGMTDVQPYEVADAAFIAEIIHRERYAIPLRQIFEEDK